MYEDQYIALLTGGGDGVTFHKYIQRVVIGGKKGIFYRMFPYESR